MSLYVEIRANDKIIDEIIITNITAKSDTPKNICKAIGEHDVCAYRVVVNSGDELFTLKHKWEDGVRVLVRKVLAKMKRKRRFGT